MRIIGDIHQKYPEYLRIIDGVDASIQVGDFGFNYDILNNVDHNKHIIIGGNHDNYDIINNNVYSHFLATYGIYNHRGLNFFYVRGAFSIDWYHRMQRERLDGIKTWWAEEELTVRQLGEAVALYKEIKPDLVITHDLPKEVSTKISDGKLLRYFGYDPQIFETNTQLAFGLMLQEHRPKMWIGGHYHTSFDKVIDGCRFKCLKELEVFDYEV